MMILLWIIGITMIVLLLVGGAIFLTHYIAEKDRKNNEEGKKAPLPGFEKLLKNDGNHEEDTLKPTDKYRPV